MRGWDERARIRGEDMGGGQGERKEITRLEGRTRGEDKRREDARWG